MNFYITLFFYWINYYLKGVVSKLEVGTGKKVKKYNDKNEDNFSLSKQNRAVSCLKI